MKHAASNFRTARASKTEIRCENGVKAFYLSHLKENDLFLHSVWFPIYLFVCLLVCLYQNITQTWMKSLTHVKKECLLPLGFSVMI